ncbi:MHS family alpha-ketoglutarate permease-like MFS transporter [Leucobacter exalbidus]|uniref:MHS family alpha-ketoglutarate permease-like MFS transporter n=1 Tax=Leucobacter exalbidus TaxID=662960 RepID=A0A940PUS6_9MICO|nr:MFS transporter [Leucobacter exalbidus]MBP1325626.1 MHS family alpha-ketoglutarate permease-like MFS transporter [Leucobacter exalbidus]
MTTTRSTTEQHHRVETRRALVGTGFGNALEWFDWAIYATFAPFFASSFFNSDNPVSAFLSTLVVFAVGFVGRPIGGFIFGRLGDRIGRRTAMSLTVGLIAAGGLLIGVSPTYDTIGVWASVLLLVARLTQGLAYGGEQPTAGAYLSERAPAKRRGLWASLIYSSGTVGVMAGMLLGAVLSAVLGAETMAAWGWRVPFIIAGLGGLYALWMRRSMPETEQFTEQIEVVLEDQTAEAAKKPGFFADMWTMRRSVMQVVGMTMGMTVAYYYWVVASSSYSISVLGADPTATLLAGVASNVLFIAFLPFWGMLSDRIGRRPVMLFGYVGLLVTLFPLSALIDGNPVHLFFAMTGAAVFLTAILSISPAVMSEIFPTRVRTVGVAVPLAVATAIFGGTSLYLQTWLTTTYGAHAFLIYLSVLLVISAYTIYRLPETKGRVLTDDTETFTDAVSVPAEAARASLK